MEDNKRKVLLDKLWKEKNAKTVIDVLKSGDINCLTLGDLKNIYVNYICYEANDKFSQDMEAYNAFEVYKNIFRGMGLQ
jgi:hypothetical protein